MLDLVIISLASLLSATNACASVFTVEDGVEAPAVGMTEHDVDRLREFVADE